MHTLRTKFKGEIISEFLAPAKPSSKVAIFCSGMPVAPKYEELLEFFSNKGFWVFLPRYRGSWESGGEFLAKSPHEDILDVIEEIPKGFVDLWSGKKYKIQSPQIYLFGGSFGGPAAILCSSHPSVSKAIATCPVIDWEHPSKDEPMDRMGDFIKEAFGEGYRFKTENWKRLANGRLYNPISEMSKAKDGKLLLIHTKDDTSVSYKPTEKFAKTVGAKLILLNKGGHGGLGMFMDPAIYKSIQKFLKE